MQCTIKGSRSNALKAKEVIEGIVKKSPQRQNPQVEEVTSDQQVEQDESGMNVVDVGGVTAVDNASLQLNPVQSMWQSSLVDMDSFTDGQFQGAFEESESQSREEKASGEITKQERVERMPKKLREDGKEDQAKQIEAASVEDQRDRSEQSDKSHQNNPTH